MDVSNTLKYIMRKENLSASKLCRKSNVANSSISDYLSGAVSPRFSTFRRITDSLDYDVVVITSTGKIYNAKDITSCLRYALSYTSVNLKTLSFNSGVSTEHLHNLILGHRDPTMRTINSILDSVGYSMKIKKRSKKE
jgi:predicted transcriptional regulator